MCVTIGSLSPCKDHKKQFTKVVVHTKTTTKQIHESVFSLAQMVFHAENTKTHLWKVVLHAQTTKIHFMKVFFVFVVWKTTVHKFCFVVVCMQNRIHKRKNTFIMCFLLFCIFITVFFMVFAWSTCCCSFVKFLRFEFDCTMAHFLWVWGGRYSDVIRFV